MPPNAIDATRGHFVWTTPDRMNSRDSNCWRNFVMAHAIVGLLMPIVRVIVVLMVFIIVTTVPVVAFVVIPLMVIAMGIDQIDLGITTGRNNSWAGVAVMVVAANFAAAEGNHGENEQTATAREDSCAD